MAAKKPDTFDVFDIDPITACQEGADLELKHPATNEPLGVFLVIKGQESDEFKDLVRKKTKLNARKGKGFRDRSDEDQAMEIVEDLLAKKNAIEAATACTVGWWRFKDAEERTGRIETMFFEKAEMPFDTAAAKRVFNARPWIAEQANSGIGDLGNFMRAKSKG